MTIVSFVLGVLLGFGSLYGASLYYCLRVMRRENLESIVQIILKDKAERMMETKEVPDGWKEIIA